MPPVATLAATIETVLLETDVPDLVLARDVVGTLYLCSFVSRDRDGDRFLCIPVSSERLAAFRSGQLDLRSLLTRPETGAWFDGLFHSVEGRPTIELERIREVPDDWLPDEGFLLTTFESPISDEDVVREALRKNATVIVCGLNPPEARGAVPKVNADRLAEGVRSFQLLVKRATKHALRTMSESTRANYAEDAYVLQVFGFSPGSFNVHFESKDHANLLGTSVVGIAMRQIDELMNLAMKPADEAMDGFRRNKGLVLAAYQQLMHFVSDENTPFAYRWSEPAMPAGLGHKVTPEAAKAMVALLQTEETLKTELVSFHGRFTSVNTDKRPHTWAARDEKLGFRHGSVHENSPDELNGVIIRTQQYLFTCEERLVRPISGKERPQLFLKSVRPTEQQNNPQVIEERVKRSV